MLEPLQHSRADQRRVLPDPAREDDRVGPAVEVRAEQVGSQVVPYPMNVDGESEARGAAA